MKVRNMSKIVVNDILDDMSDENNRLLATICTNINDFSVDLKNNKIQRNSKTIMKLNDLQKDYKKLVFNQNYLQKAIQYFIDVFREKIIKNKGQKSGPNRVSKLGRPALKPKVKETDSHLKFQLITELIQKCNRNEESDKTVEDSDDRPIAESNGSQKVFQYTCDECVEQFDCELDLEIHVNREHRDVESYVCHECKQLFESKQLFLDHLSTEHKNPVFECDSCAYKTPYESRLALHKANHTVDPTTGPTTNRPFKCDVKGCKKAYKSYQALYSHKKCYNHSITRFHCDFPECIRSFKNKIAFNRHKKSHKKSGNIFSYYKRSQYKQKLIDSMIGSAISAAYKPGLANISPKKERDQSLVYMTSNEMTKYMTRKQKPLDSSQAFSETEIDSKYSLITEIFKNKNTNKTNEDLSEANVSKAKDMNGRQKAIRNEFVCDRCAEKFVSELDLEFHVNSVHKNKRLLIECNECNDMFNSKYLLLKHLEQKHNKNPVINAPEDRDEDIEGVLDSDNISQQTADNDMNCTDAMSDNSLAMDSMEEKRENEPKLSQNSNRSEVLDKSSEELSETECRETNDLTKTTKSNPNEANVIPICDECNELFESDLELEEHTNSVHKNKESISKQKVSRKSLKAKNISILDKQFNEKHRIGCKVCQTIFISEEELKEHAIEYETEDNTKCLQCHQNFGTERTLILHKYTVHQQFYYKCQTCDYITQNEQNIQIHVKTENHFRQEINPIKSQTNISTPLTTKPLVIVLNPNTMTTTVKTNAKQLSGTPAERPVMLNTYSRPKTTQMVMNCNECQFETQDSALMSEHNKTHESIDNCESESTGRTSGALIKQFSCGICNQLFDSKTVLITHMKDKHKTEEQNGFELTAEKSNTRAEDQKKSGETDENDCFVCNCCDCFEELIELREHLYKIHKKYCKNITALSELTVRHSNKIHEFFCQLCKNSYDTDIGVEKHIKKHKTIQIRHRFKCNDCKESYKSEPELIRHTNTTHSLQPTYDCHECQKRFYAKPLYLTHMSAKHKKIGFECDSCDYIAWNGPELNQHYGQEEHELICDSCKIGFTTNRYLLEHKKQTHSTSTKPVSPEPIDENSCGDSLVIDINAIESTVEIDLGNSSNHSNDIVLDYNSEVIETQVKERNETINSIEENVNKRKNEETIESDICVKQRRVESTEDNDVVNKGNSSSEQMDLSSDQLETTSEKLDLSSDQLETTSEKLDLSSDQLTTTSEKLDLSSDQLKTTSEKMDLSSDQLKTTSEKVDLSSDQLNTNSSKSIVESETESKTERVVVQTTEEQKKCVSLGESVSPKTKVFYCNKCDQTLDSFSLFVSHNKTHFKSNEIALKCIDCPFVSKDLQSLISHQKSHKIVKQNLFKCCVDECAASFEDWSKLKVHLECEHKRVFCLKCKQYFKSQYSLNNHLIDCQK